MFIVTNRQLVLIRRVLCERPLRRPLLFEMAYVHPAEKEILKEKSITDG